MLDFKSLSLGQVVKQAGYVTTLRSVLVGGSRPVDLERKLGFSPGAMVDGYVLLVLDTLAQIAENEFEFRGYTHLSDGKAAGSDQNTHQDLEQRLSGNSIDRAVWQRLRKEGAQRLNRGGADVLCKVVFSKSENVLYPTGSGVVQYVLTQPKPFVVTARVGPKESLVALGGGRVAVQGV